MSRIVVIGANRGIGLEVCRQLVARGDEVVAVCRRRSDELDGLSGLQVIDGVDVTDAASLAHLRGQLGEGRVEGLLVVAGILERTPLSGLDVAAVRRQLEVNAIGPLVAVSELLPCLTSGAKIGLLTSRMGSISDNTSGGSYGYRMSKAALNIAGVSLAHDLKPKGIAVRLIHPGWVRTEMTGNTGHLSAAESASGVIARFDELTLEQTGSFVHVNGESLPW